MIVLFPTLGVGSTNLRQGSASIGTAKTVGNYLIALEEAGILNSIKAGKEKLYLNHSLMKVFENK